MPDLVARLLLVLTIILAVPFVYLTAFSVFAKSWFGANVNGILATDIMTAASFVPGWILIWHRRIRWTPKRWRLTCLALLWSLVPAFLLGMAIVAVTPYALEAAAALGGGIWWVAWMASTVLIWRETPLERAQRLGAISKQAIACPACGYNMTGLRQARCPECGTEYTLDELFGSLRGKADDLESDQPPTV